MIIKYYRDSDDIKGSSGGIKNFFKELAKDPKLWNLVYETYKQVKFATNLDVFFKNEYISPVHYIDEPIYEFRIPPKKRKEGVARLYFGHKQNVMNTIIILSAEIKHGKKSSDAEKIKQAVQRYREVCK